jgi:4-amino-4-deoxy-L-arabinose transferase-like glycosyltransferase
MGERRRDEAHQGGAREKPMKPADLVSPNIVAIKVIAFWKTLSARWNPIVTIVAAWALLALPLVFFRGFNSDEGVAVGIARSALEGGDWLTPHLFDLRFVERPTLLSWIIAAFSLPFGNVGQVSARIPVALFLLGGCLLIFHLLRRANASISAALLGVALFLACPLVVRSYVMTTADMPLAVLLFLSFVLWWDGNAEGRIGLGRWTAIGCVLALAALMKGPQPIAYFAVGVGAFILIARAWRQIPGFVFAGIVCVIPLVGWYAHVYKTGDVSQWLTFMRLSTDVVLSGPLKGALELLIQTLPAALLASAFFLSSGYRTVARTAPNFVKALACYAFITTLIVLCWPGGSAARYFYPMVLPLCVFGALAYDSLAKRAPQAVAPVLILTLGLLAYAFTYSAIASPALPAQFRSTKLDAARITQLVRRAPAPIFRTSVVVGLNIFPYIPDRITTTKAPAMETIRGPAWLAMPAKTAEDILKKRPNDLHTALSFGNHQEWRLLRLENPQPR